MSIVTMTDATWKPKRATTPSGGTRFQTGTVVSLSTPAPGIAIVHIVSVPTIAARSQLRCMKLPWVQRGVACGLPTNPAGSSTATSFSDSSGTSLPFPLSVDLSMNATVASGCAPACVTSTPAASCSRALTLPGSKPNSAAAGLATASAAASATMTATSGFIAGLRSDAWRPAPAASP